MKYAKSLIIALFLPCLVNAANVVRNATTQQEYETFDAAITAAVTGDRLELMADVAFVTNTISGKEIEFSGGDYKFSSSKITLSSKAILKIKDGDFSNVFFVVDKKDGTASKLLIEDGRFDQPEIQTYGSGRTIITGGEFTSLNEIGLICYNKGQAEVLGGKFSGIKFHVQNYDCKITFGDGENANPLICEGCHFKVFSSWASINQSGNQTSIDINEGTYKACGFFTDYCNYLGSSSKMTLNVNNGEFLNSYFQAGITEIQGSGTSTTPGYSTINVVDGNFKNCRFVAVKYAKSSLSSTSLYKCSPASVNVSGGTFEDCGSACNGENASIYVDESKVSTFPAVDQVSSTPFVVGGNAYSSLSEAYNVAQDGEEIKLSSCYFATAAESFTLDSSKTVYLDTNGYTFFGRGNKLEAKIDDSKINDGLNKPCLILSGDFVGAYINSTTDSGSRLTSVEKKYITENPLIVLKDGFYVDSRFESVWSGTVKVNDGIFMSCVLNAYNFSSSIIIGGPDLTPELFGCVISVMGAHNTRSQDNNSDAFGIINSGKFYCSEIGCVAARNNDHTPSIDVCGGEYFSSHFKCLKQYDRSGQMATMRIYGERFLDCTFAESGADSFSGNEYGVGNYESDLVICSGRYSEEPQTASGNFTIGRDPEYQVYFNSKPGVIYKYHLAKPDWLRVKVR